jgi:predicted DNA-binding protein
MVRAGFGRRIAPRKLRRAVDREKGRADAREAPRRSLLTLRLSPTAFNMLNMIGVRMDPEMERRLEAAARREGRTKSAIVREAVERYLRATDLVEEARSQSLRVSGDAASRDAPERAAADFVGRAANLEGWEE